MMLLREVLSSYYRPRQVLRAKLEATGEGKAFAYLLLGCVMHYCGQLPKLHSSAVAFHQDIPIAGNLAGNFFGMIIVAPFMFYVLAVSGRLLVGLMGWDISWSRARVALFWAFLIVFPMSLMNGILWAVLMNETVHRILQAVIFAVFLGFWLYALYVAKSLVKPAKADPEPETS